MAGGFCSLADECAVKLIWPSTSLQYAAEKFKTTPKALKKNVYLNKYVYKTVHSAIIHNDSTKFRKNNQKFANKIHYFILKKKHNNI